ncbi:MAG: hypothetical protein ACI9LY_001601 [Arenicella sp.]|jgi:hypothetical protein
MSCYPHDRFGLTNIQIGHVFINRDNLYASISEQGYHDETDVISLNADGNDY